MTRTLSNHIKKFDLNNLGLSFFFTEVAIDLSNLHKKNLVRLDETSYDKIYKAAEIIKYKSRELRAKKENFRDIQFFWKFYGKKEDERNIEYARIVYANKLINLSEDLLATRHFPEERIEKLTSICVKLSEETRKYWNEHNPRGFKKYSHH